MPKPNVTCVIGSLVLLQNSATALPLDQQQLLKPNRKLAQLGVALDTKHLQLQQLQEAQAQQAASPPPGPDSPPPPPPLSPPPVVLTAAAQLSPPAPQQTQSPAKPTLLTGANLDQSVQYAAPSPPPQQPAVVLGAGLAAAATQSRSPPPPTQLAASPLPPMPTQTPLSTFVSSPPPPSPPPPPVPKASPPPPPLQYASPPPPVPARHSSPPPPPAPAAAQAPPHPAASVQPQDTYKTAPLPPGWPSRTPRHRGQQTSVKPTLGAVTSGATQQTSVKPTLGVVTSGRTQQTSVKPALGVVTPGVVEAKPAPAGTLGLASLGTVAPSQLPATLGAPGSLPEEFAPIEGILGVQSFLGLGASEDLFSGFEGTTVAAEAPYDLLAIAIFDSSGENFTCIPCNLTGDSRYDTGSKFPLNVAVPIGTRVRVIFANGELKGDKVTREGEPATRIGEDGDVETHQLGGSSPILDPVGGVLQQTNSTDSLRGNATILYNDYDEASRTAVCSPTGGIKSEDLDELPSARVKSFLAESDDELVSAPAQQLPYLAVAPKLTQVQPPISGQVQLPQPLQTAPPVIPVALTTQLPAKRVVPRAVPQAVTQSLPSGTGKTPTFVQPTPKAAQYTLPQGKATAQATPAASWVTPQATPKATPAPTKPQPVVTKAPLQATPKPQTPPNPIPIPQATPAPYTPQPTPQATPQATQAWTTQAVTQAPVASPPPITVTVAASQDGGTAQILYPPPPPDDRNFQAAQAALVETPQATRAAQVETPVAVLPQPTPTPVETPQPTNASVIAVQSVPPPPDDDRDFQLPANAQVYTAETSAEPEQEEAEQGTDVEELPQQSTSPPPVSPPLPEEAIESP